MFTLVLNYIDGSKFIVGGFNSEDLANAWLGNEKLQPYWVDTTTGTITENPPVQND